jgi:hypothetical protein
MAEPQVLVRLEDSASPTFVLATEGIRRFRNRQCRQKNPTGRGVGFFASIVGRRLPNLGSRAEILSSVRRRRRIHHPRRIRRRRDVHHHRRRRHRHVLHAAGLR